MDIDPAWTERGLAVVALAISNGVAKFISYARKRDKINAAIGALHEGAERFKKLENRFEDLADGVYRRLGRVEKELKDFTGRTPSPFERKYDPESPTMPGVKSPPEDKK